jgi:hypothetical protein
LDASHHTHCEEYELPDAEALHAATLALMTGHAQQSCPQRRSLMARKIRSNLFFLYQHPGLTPELRRVLQRLHGMWDTMVQSGGTEAPSAKPPASAPQPTVQPAAQRAWPTEPVASQAHAAWLH